MIVAGEIIQRERTDSEIDQMENDNLNLCDKCGRVDDTDNLIWIDSEDFEPAEGEKLKRSTYNKYSALCDPCYQDCLV